MCIDVQRVNLRFPKAASYIRAFRGRGGSGQPGPIVARVSSMKIKLPKEVVWTKLGEEVAILNSETGTYFGLDPVGSRIWCLMADGCPIDEVVAKLLTEYEVDEERVRKDLRDLIAELEQRSLVKIASDEDLAK